MGRLYAFWKYEVFSTKNFTDHLRCWRAVENKLMPYQIYKFQRQLTIIVLII